MFKARAAIGMACAAIAAGPAVAQQGAASVSGAVGRSYAGSTEGMSTDLAVIARLPSSVAPLPLQIKPAAIRGIKGKNRVAVAGYGLYVVRTGKVSAFAGGFGSSMMARRSTIETALVGVPDDMIQALAGEAYDDLLTRLKAAGFETLSYAELQSRPGFADIPSGGSKTMVAGQPIYGPPDKPLKAGSLFYEPTKVGRGWQTLGDDGLVVLNPTMGLDYNWLEGSGTRNYGSSASTSAKAWFSVQRSSGAYVYVKDVPPYRGVGVSALITDAPIGTAEPFAVMTQASDRSDSASLSSALALAGLGSVYRQKKLYAVEVAPNRYAALVRAAYQGLNISLVEQLKKAAQ